MKKRIHVNMPNIRKNNKDFRDRPVVTIKTSKENIYAHEVEILGPSKMVYLPSKPLSCGARVWVETESKLRARTGKDEYREID